MKQKLKLSNICKGKTYKIESFSTGSEDYSRKLKKMGFVENTPVELAPVNTSDPMIFQIRNSRLALRKSEAESIMVEEVENA